MHNLYMGSCPVGGRPHVWRRMPPADAAAAVPRAGDNRRCPRQRMAAAQANAGVSLPETWACDTRSASHMQAACWLSITSVRWSDEDEREDAHENTQFTLQNARLCSVGPSTATPACGGALTPPAAEQLARGLNAPQPPQTAPPQAPSARRPQESAGGTSHSTERLVRNARVLSAASAANIDESASMPKACWLESLPQFSMSENLESFVACACCRASPLANGTRDAYWMSRV